MPLNYRLYSLKYPSSGIAGCFETVHRLVCLLRNVVPYGIVLRFDLFYITSLRISQMLLLAPTIITIYPLQSLCDELRILMVGLRAPSVRILWRRDLRGDTFLWCRYDQWFD